MLIGEIEGTTSTSEFKFRAYKDIKKFDFVAVKTEISEEEVWILSQVQEVKKHPEGKTEAEAEIIGYRKNGLMKRPRGAIKPGSNVYKAPQDLISETLGLIEEGLYLGDLESDSDIGIFLDPEDLYKHLAVLAKTGSGKSYVAGVVVEELLEKDYPVIIIDPHGEYHTLKEENQIPESAKKKFEIEEKGYKAKLLSPNTEINRNAINISFSDRNLKPKELEQLIPTSLTNSQLGVLYKVLKDLEGDYDLDKIIDESTQADSKAKWNLVSMLEMLRDSDLFSDNPTDLKELINPGKASIVNLKGSEPETQQIIVYLLAKELFRLRKIGEIKPFIMLVEEAHNFVPERNFGKAVCSDILRTIASEGRKFGLGMIVVSQRPARIDKNVLSQCNTQIIMRVTNPNDLGAISKSFEGVTPGVKSSITGLPQGVGFILGKEYPIMTDIRARRSKHGGETKEVSEEAEEEKVKVFIPDISKNELEQEHTEKFNTAYYPYWFIDFKNGGMVLDAREEEVKAKMKPLGELEEKILGILNEEPRSKSDLLEELDKNFSKVSSAIKTLKDYKLIEEYEKEQKTFYGSKGNLFGRKKDFLGVKGGKIIEHSITKEKAKEIASNEFDEVPENVELVYHMFYSSEDKVFDSLTGEELE